MAEVFPRGDYRDPLEVLIRRESRTCAGCAFVAVAFGERYCGKGRRFGSRCLEYREGCLSEREIECGKS